MLSSFMLGHFMQTKYSMIDNRNPSISKAEYEGMKRARKEFSLEEELQVRATVGCERGWAHGVCILHNAGEWGELTIWARKWSKRWI